MAPVVPMVEILTTRIVNILDVCVVDVENVTVCVCGGIHPELGK